MIDVNSKKKLCITSTQHYMIRHSTFLKWHFLLSSSQVSGLAHRYCVVLVLHIKVQVCFPFSHSAHIWRIHVSINFFHLWNKTSNLVCINDLSNANNRTKMNRVNLNMPGWCVWKPVSSMRHYRKLSSWTFKDCVNGVSKKPGFILWAWMLSIIQDSPSK